jgi:molecular chaperone DnaK (HSP70)
VIYAIDFGTSNTVIARANAVTEQPEILTLKGLTQSSSHHPSLIPSLLYVENAEHGQVIVGQAVGDRGLDIVGKDRFFRRFKRGIGSPIQGFLPELDEKTLSFEQIGDWFLSAILEQLQLSAAEPIQSLVLTVPVASFEAYRLWLSQVCQRWSIAQVQLLDEPTAAALGYGTNQDELLLIIDFGGGTIDLSLVQFEGQQAAAPQGTILKWGQKQLDKSTPSKNKLARVLAKIGTNLGGSDLDDWILDYFVTNLGLAKSAITLRLAERLKIQLSRQEQAIEAFFDDKTLDSYDLSLTRAEFEQILQQNDFFIQLDELMTQLLQQGQRNGIERPDIDRVLLIGGTGQIPAVQSWVQRYFDPSKIKCDRPFEAVALGALKLAQGLDVRDYLYHSYGIRYWNRRKNCHSWHPIIKMGQPYPMSQPFELTLGASLDNQPSIELIVGELGSEQDRTEVYFDGDRLLTRSLSAQAANIQALNDRDGARTIARLDPLGQPGRDRIKIRFWIDEQRFLRMTVEDLLLNRLLLNNQVVAQLS